MDNQAAQVWLQQEGAFHLGMAVGLKLAEGGYRIPDDDEPVDPDELEIEDALRFGGRSDDDTEAELHHSQSVSVIRLSSARPGVIRREEPHVYNASG